MPGKNSNLRDKYQKKVLIKKEKLIAQKHKKEKALKERLSLNKEPIGRFVRDYEPIFPKGINKAKRAKRAKRREEGRSSSYLANESRKELSSKISSKKPLAHHYTHHYNRNAALLLPITLLLCLSGLSRVGANLIGSREVSASSSAPMSNIDWINPSSFTLYSHILSSSTATERRSSRVRKSARVRIEDCEIADHFLHDPQSLAADLEREVASISTGASSAESVISTVYAVNSLNLHCLTNATAVEEGRVSTHNGGIVGAIPDQYTAYPLVTGMAAEVIGATAEEPDSLTAGHQGKIQKFLGIPAYFGAHGAHRVAAVIDQRIKDYFDAVKHPHMLPSGKTVPPEPPYFALTEKGVDAYIALQQLVYLAERAAEQHGEGAPLPMVFTVAYSPEISEKINNDPKLKALMEEGRLRVREPDARKIPHKKPSESDCLSMTSRALEEENLYYGEGTQQTVLPAEAIRLLGACGVKTFNLDFASLTSRKNLFAHLGFADFLLAHAPETDSPDFRANLVVIKNVLEALIPYTSEHKPEEFRYEWLMYQPWKAIAFAYQTLHNTIPDEKIPGFTPKLENEDYWQLFSGNIASSLLIVLLMQLRNKLNTREKGSKCESILRAMLFCALAYTNTLLPWSVKMISVSGVNTPYSLACTVSSYLSAYIMETVTDLIKRKEGQLTLLAPRDYLHYRRDFAKAAVHGVSEQGKKYESLSPEITFLLGCVAFNIFGLTDITHTARENAFKVLCMSAGNAMPLIIDKTLSKVLKPAMERVSACCYTLFNRGNDNQEPLLIDLDVMGDYQPLPNIV